MRKASLWMFLLAVLVLPAVAVAEEYRVLLQPANEQNAAPVTVPCNTEPGLAAIFTPMSQADMKATYITGGADFCCSQLGCCTHMQSGCDQCPGGYRWFSIYRCDNNPDYTCKIYPESCPTPC